MVTFSGSPAEAEPPFRPLTASFFSIDSQICGKGLYADVRHYGWHQTIDGTFQSPAYLINFNLKPRVGGCLTMRRTGQSEYLAPGTIAFIPAGEIFAAHCEPSVAYDLCVTLSPSRAELLIGHNVNLAELDPCMDIRNRSIHQLLTRLAAEVVEPGFGSEIVAESLTAVLMVEVCRHLGTHKIVEAEPSGKMPNWRLRRIIERLHDTLGEPLSLSELAAEFGISARHLARTFKNTTGVTFSDYIANARIQRARELLVRNDLLIKQVSSSCGFRSAAAFSAAFRTATGQTPREFQQEAFFARK